MKWTEITGVDKNVDFKVKGLSETCRIIEQPTDFQRIAVVIPGGELIGASAWVYDEIMYAAPSGIIHLPPPLTDEQREQLRHIYGLGGRYLAKDASGIVFCYQARPEKEDIEWTVRDPNDEFMEITYFVPTVACLVSWSDSEPYNIGKALGVGE